MFQEVLSEKAQDLIDKITGQISSFYLAGGTALALQLGHRVSEDLDFFIDKAFDAEGLKNSKGWTWDSVRSFFETHLREFEMALINGVGD